MGLQFYCAVKCAVHQKDLLEFEDNGPSMGKDSALACIRIFLYHRKRRGKIALILKAERSLGCLLS